MSVLFSGDNGVNYAIKNYLDRKLAAFGNFKYAYIIINKKNPMNIFVISNYPSEWAEIYIANNYQHIDPVVLSALQRVSPFSWDENISINSLVNFSKIFNISKNYDIINGYTFVLHDNNNNIAMLSIMMDNMGIADIEDEIKYKKADLQLLLITVHEKVTSLYQEVTQHKHHNTSSEKDLFSERENEILYWASVGKTYQEIALILGVKISTVKFHMGNVVKKLGVINAKHAIRMGVELQLIKPIPR
ncbi:LuxR family transcriptional regulator [Serratia fonticola]|uniref:LuxR family transcriptional regulator n=1 Tax=Serratia fonticola TaxID=47917 RepID=UPI002097129E|nr:LuxR family transcriptional regulator [Serratia fonticola]MCO7512414.1 LuxR family transcriptional regulator [Serratia fonticola]